MWVVVVTFSSFGKVLTHENLLFNGAEGMMYHVSGQSNKGLTILQADMTKQTLDMVKFTFRVAEEIAY